MTPFLGRRQFSFCVLFCLIFFWEEFTDAQVDLWNRIAKHYPKQDLFKYNNIRQQSGYRNPAKTSLASGTPPGTNSGDRFPFQKSQKRNGIR